MSELETQKQEWSNLVKSAGWALLVEVMEAQEKVRVNTILVPEANDEERLKKEFLKCEVAMLRTIRRLPELVLEQIEDDMTRESTDDREE